MSTYVEREQRRRSERKGHLRAVIVVLAIYAAFWAISRLIDHVTDHPRVKIEGTAWGEASGGLRAGIEFVGPNKFGNPVFRFRLANVGDAAIHVLKPKAHEWLTGTPMIEVLHRDKVVTHKWPRLDMRGYLPRADDILLIPPGKEYAVEATLHLGQWILRRNYKIQVCFACSRDASEVTARTGLVRRLWLGEVRSGTATVSRGLPGVWAIAVRGPILVAFLVALGLVPRFMQRRRQRQSEARRVPDKTAGGEENKSA